PPALSPTALPGLRPLTPRYTISRHFTPFPSTSQPSSTHCNASATSAAHSRSTGCCSARGKRLGPSSVVAADPVPIDRVLRVDEEERKEGRKEERNRRREARRRTGACGALHGARGVPAPRRTHPQ